MDSAYLKKCDRIYEELLNHIRILREKGESEAVLRWINVAAGFARWNAVGRYADGRLENIAFEIGNALGRAPLRSDYSRENYKPRELPRDGRRKILHVATSVFGVGGHTRLISNWIKNDPGSCHSLIITNQESDRMPEWLTDAVSENGGVTNVFPPGAGLQAKARWLREIARRDVDVVVLHHHPDDVVPVIAFAAPEGPPVALLNHADHMFWLGSSIADTVINLRASGRELSEKRRFAKHTSLLPIPLEITQAPPTRSEARRRLNIPEDQVMLLSVGSAYKYTPTETHNFYRLATQILDRNPAAHLYLIGVDAKEGAGHLNETKQDRLHFLGVIEQPFLHQAAADLYVEGFPFGSLTALLEAAALGVCPVLALAPASKVLASDDLALDDVVANAASEDEYVQNVSSLIQDRSERERLGGLIRERVNDYHAGHKWRECLQEIYRFLEGKQHAPGAIPHAAYTETNDDLSWSRFNLILQGSALLILLSLGYKNFHKLSFREMTDLFIMSLRIRDTKISYTHLYRCWWRELFKPKIRSWRALRS